MRDEASNQGLHESMLNYDACDHTHVCARDRVHLGVQPGVLLVCVVVCFSLCTRLHRLGSFRSSASPSTRMRGGISAPRNTIWKRTAPSQSWYVYGVCVSVSVFVCMRFTDRTHYFTKKNGCECAHTTNNTTGQGRSLDYDALLAPHTYTLTHTGRKRRRRSGRISHCQNTLLARLGWLRTETSDQSPVTIAPPICALKCTKTRENAGVGSILDPTLHEVSPTCERINERTEIANSTHDIKTFHLI